MSTPHTFSLAFDEDAAERRRLRMKPLSLPVWFVAVRIAPRNGRGEICRHGLAALLADHRRAEAAGFPARRPAARR
jgi:hypothetical protein